MSNVTRQILIESNQDLFREIQHLISLIEQVTPSPELKAYRDSVYTDCQNLCQEIKQNLDEIKVKPASVFTTLLSNMQRLNTEFIFYNQHFIGPLRRTMPEDRLPLHILHWLYEEHATTRNIPVALTNSAFQVWPEINKPTLYGVPVSIQQGLLYLPLLFHEFGHQLFICFGNELDQFIRDLQRKIEFHLTPWTQSSDEHAIRDRRRRRDIVETWYYWCEELFCDAVGLTIGGPAYLYALDRYVRISQREEYHAPRQKLSYRGHPIFRLRMRLLVQHARELKCTAVADTIERNWNNLATLLCAKEDYYGFYEVSWFSIIQTTLKRMVEEVGPYRFTDEDLSPTESISLAKPVHLLNYAWNRYITAPEGYIDWELEIMKELASAG